MDGKSMLRRLYGLLNEASTSEFLNRRASFDYLYEAAKEYVRLTGCLRAYQDITTVADTAGYKLNGDFLKLYAKDPDTHNYFVRYYDGSDYFYLPWQSYSNILFDNNTTSIDIPSNFSLTEYTDLDDRLTGVATSTGTHSGGKARLTASAGDFTNVTAGDIVHNTTQSSDGVVIEKISTTVVDTAIFGSTGAEASWAINDAYIIQPRGRMQLVLDPPPDTADETVRVWYVQKPQPVYSDYDVYRIPYDYAEALVKYAAWLYKYKDKEPNLGDAWYRYWLFQVSAGISAISDAFVRGSRIIPRLY